MSRKYWRYALLSDDGEDDPTSTEKSIEPEDRDSSNGGGEDTSGDKPDGDTEGGDDPPKEDNPLTDENVPPEDRPRPEDIGLSTDAVLDQSNQIKRTEEIEGKE